ncbi:thyroid transcription factor 1-associated protein 26 homolog [Conger conger]|uniref:thyroid transcription factor 1-associated protein 26 homolog n=1 Tax=Conger conger TaxID=82655 RepID=UPI002A59D461|nr:thyroid transcription factor 1-associated protein 26 homolog [Conger conger]
MAPFKKFAKTTGKHIAKNANQARKQQPGFKNKKPKWVPEGKIFHGSVQEGQGFAFKRKQKAQHAYNKLLRKQASGKPVKTAFEQEYPEHLKHLYQAEADQLRKEDQINRLRRRKAPPTEQASGEDRPSSHTEPQPSSSPGPRLPQPALAEPSGLNPSKKKMRKLTSYQKTREEYESAMEQRAKKKEEALRNKQQREEALKVYKEKKMQTYQMLCKKTRKGQPNLNLQMEYLLQKIHNKTQNQAK